MLPIRPLCCPTESPVLTCSLDPFGQHAFLFTPSNGYSKGHIGLQAQPERKDRLLHLAAHSRCRSIRQSCRSFHLMLEIQQVSKAISSRLLQHRSRCDSVVRSHGAEQLQRGHVCRNQLLSSAQVISAAENIFIVTRMLYIDEAKVWSVCAMAPKH